ncbi:MAG TPA: M48 family metalloprotease, partial [Burkholderiaceae bacterium]|nr:M48 family metalloprotease [Burkholderiaceae bacterium]
PSVRLPALGDAASEDFSVGTERRIGEQIMAEVRRDPAYLDDPLLLDYVQSLWSPLVAAARTRGNIGADLDTAFAWEAFLVRDRSVNAFALPGGFVGVHLGLVAMTGTRDELASVLAHELSHVTQRHIARGLASSSRQSVIGLAAILLGVLAASRANSADAAQAAIVGGQAAMAQGQLNFTRDMEREADRIGWSVFQDAGYAAQGMAMMFERLDYANRLVDNGAYPYLRSHPLTVDRIGEARARVDASPSGAKAAPRPALNHLLMQARARVLMDPTVQALRRAQAQETGAAGGGERIAALYASALASFELREFERTQAALDAALPLARSAAPEDARAQLALLLTQAQVWRAVGQAPRALAALDAWRTPPAEGMSRPLLLARAQAAIDVARGGGGDALRPSVEALQTWVAEHKDDALAWSLLGQGAEQQGLKLRALRAQAEAQAASGDLPGAIDRLRAAQRQARPGGGATVDFVEASIIDARLRDLLARRRAQIAEMRGGRGPSDERTP